MPRTEVEQIFAKYGPIVGISLHKGYGFVQYGNEFNARMAVKGEDNKIYYGMALGTSNPHGLMDVMQAQALAAVGGQLSQLSIPGSHPQVMGQFHNMMGNNMQHNFQNQVFPINSNTSGAKRTRLDANSMCISRNRNLVSLVSGNSDQGNNRKFNRNYHNTGSNIRNVTSHKSSVSKKDVVGPVSAGEPESLDCAYCRQNFATSWELIHHCQKDHGLTIYSLPDKQEASSEATSNTSSRIPSPTRGNGVKTKVEEPTKSEEASENPTQEEESEVNVEESADDTEKEVEADVKTEDPVESQDEEKSVPNDEETENSEVQEPIVAGSKRKTKKSLKEGTKEVGAIRKGKSPGKGKAVVAAAKAAAAKRATRSRTRRSEETGRHENVSEEEYEDDDDEQIEA